MNKAWRRLRRYWNWYLAESYYQTTIIAVIVCIGVFLSLHWDSDALANLSTSLMDGRPWMFLLVAWCVIRFLHLASHALFRTKVRESRFIRRIWKACVEAMAVMLGSFAGAVLGLYLHGFKRTDNVMALCIVLFFALVRLSAAAYDMPSHRSLSISRNSRRWLGLGCAVFLLICLGVNGDMSEHKSPNQSCTTGEARNA